MNLPIDLILKPNTIAFIFIVVGTILILWKDRNKIERDSFIFMRRTEKGIGLIDSIAKKAPRFWKWYSNVGIVVSIGALIIGFGLIVFNGIKVFLLPAARSGVGLVVPAPTSQITLGTGFLAVPLWLWIIAIGSLMVFHELSHGIVGRNEGFTIKSVGWVIFGIIPGAFVEPEGEDMLADKNKDKEENYLAEGENEEEKSEPWEGGTWLERTRVLAAGSFANFLTAGITLLTLVILFNSALGFDLDQDMYNTQGITVSAVGNNTPASRAGLVPNKTIYRINNKRINTSRDYNEFISNQSINSTITLFSRDNSSYLVNVGEKPEKNYSYKPAPVDYILANLEKMKPGTIENYEKHNNFIADDDLEVKISRWTWIKRNYPDLKEVANKKIRQLKERLPNEPWIGIAQRTESKLKANWKPYFGLISGLISIMSAVLIIHFGIGLANMLPIKPLDGGMIVETITEEFVPQKSELITRRLTLFMIAILVFSIIVTLSGHIFRAINYLISL